MMLRKSPLSPALIFVCLFALCVTAPVIPKGNADDSVVQQVLQNTAQENPPVPEDTTVYRIADIHIDIEGQTKAYAVKKAGRIRVGKTLTGLDQLQKYIADKYHILEEKRTFDEASIVYTLGEPDEKNQIPVTLIITLKDTWNMVAVPAPTYDSNEGFNLSLSGRDFNFLGTLNPLKVDIGYELDNHSNHSFLFAADLMFPFELWGHIWTLDFDNSFKFSQTEPIYYGNDIGLLVDFPFKETTLTLGAYESIYVNEENEDRYKASEGFYFKDVWYLNTEVLARWEIPTGYEVYTFGELVYTPEINFSINYRPGGDIGPSRRGFEMGTKQFLGFGEAKWKGDFREGLIAEIQNNDLYNFYTGKWDNELFVTGIYHRIFKPWLGISGRIRWAQWFNEYYDDAGDMLRGIPDELLSADYMLSINLEVPMKLFSFKPSEWFNKPKLRIINFVEHITPFVDIALVKDPINHRSFGFEDMAVTVGLELTTYPEYFKSAYFRVSLGIDLKEVIRTGKLPDEYHRELFVGLGHFF